MTTCKEVMSKDVKYALPNDGIKQVAQLMRSENIGSVPVVATSSGRKVVGIVTDRDLALKVLVDDVSPSVRVESVMTEDVVTCSEDDAIDIAMKAMSEHQVRRMPIVNARNELVGIIAQADIATRVNQPNKTAEVVEEISEA